MTVRKSTWGLLAMVLLGETATIAIGLIVWGVFGWKSALVTGGIGELLVLVALGVLITRGVKSMNKPAKPTSTPRSPHWDYDGTSSEQR